MAFDVELHAGLNGSWLYVPRGQQRPAIVVLHGSEGGHAGWAQWQALRLAHSGFCTIAPNYSVGGKLWHAGDIRDVNLDPTEDLLVWMRNHPLTSGKVGLYGASRGAEHALLVTSLMAKDHSDGLPDAVAVHAPPDTIADAFIAKDFDPNNHETWDPARRPWKWRGTSETLQPTTPIEIEQYDGPLFLSHGEDDRVWTVECTKRLEQRLINAGKSPEVHVLKGEGHGFGPKTEAAQHARLLSFFCRSLLSEDCLDGS